MICKVSQSWLTSTVHTSTVFIFLMTEKIAILQCWMLLISFMIQKWHHLKGSIRSAAFFFAYRLLIYIGTSATDDQRT
ncbi:hypothetical protein D6C13_10280 [Rahnella woolbedingensis]|uniref:Uncharacterized protein n=1 Tax=Rahnella woolbedingensis TaxID=1510574 RepID=A0A419N9N4_9GAMM|nr:hypothetical protein D6C13_10280 [Rahnella woolbedingensis]